MTQNDNDLFIGLLRLKAQQEEQEAQAQRASEERQAAVDAFELDVKSRWLCQTLDNLGIIYSKPPVAADNIVIGKFRFRISAGGGGFYTVNERRGFNAPANPRAVQLGENNYNDTSFNLSITHIGLALEAVHRRAEKTPYYVSILESISVTVPAKKGWPKIAEEVANVIASLTQQFDALEERTAKAKAEYEAKQAQIKADNEAEEKREAEWEVRSAARRAEAEQQRAERQAREAKYRAEVAAKFDVSVEAFDYLVEALANEISRRALINRDEYPGDGYES